MGKAKRKRSHRLRFDPVASQGESANDPSTAPSEEQTHRLLSDLCSLSEYKRLQSLELFSSMTRFNPRFITSDFLSKLNLRLVDSSLRVRVSAATTVRNIACDPELIPRLLEGGVASTILSILMNEGEELFFTVISENNEKTTSLFIHLLSALSNIW